MIKSKLLLALGFQAQNGPESIERLQARCFFLEPPSQAPLHMTLIYQNTDLLTHCSLFQRKLKHRKYKLWGVKQNTALRVWFSYS